MTDAMEVDKEWFPSFDLAQKRFELLNSDLPPNLVDKHALKNEILEVVKAKHMLPFYNDLCTAAAWAPDEALKADLKKKNDEELAKLDEKIKDAQENLGDVEVRDGMLAKAEFYTRIGDKDKAYEEHQVAFEKTVGAGGKLDNILSVIRISFFYDEKDRAKKEIERAKAELAKGGDWERRNKLKVYEGVMLMNLRQFDAAAKNFLDAMPTFTAVELVTFKDFVFYTVLTSMVALDRKANRERVIHCPEILSVIDEIPHLRGFMESFYYGRYKEFMEHFAHVIDLVRKDRYLSKHVRHFMRIMRLNAYRQFLASYRSVTLDAMSGFFGVSPAFLDTEISSFISSGKLACKIDKVGGVVESNVIDQRSTVYTSIIKQGDLLLNRMQRLSAAIDM